MAERLAGKVAVVTGSTSGIGEGIARAFCAEGARVVVSGRRAERGEAIAAELREAGSEAIFHRADVAEPDNCRLLIDAAVEAWGGLDCLVNNAAIFPRSPFLETTPEFFDQVFTINLRGPFLCAQAAIPHLRQRGGGVILNIGSGNGFLTGDKLITYGVSKGALHNLTMNLAKNYAAEQIRVNWVTVGWVLTEMEFVIQAEEGRDRDDIVQHGEQLPMGEFNTVEDIAAACLYLASDEARHVTGCELNASAGLRIRV